VVDIFKALKDVFTDNQANLIEVMLWKMFKKHETEEHQEKDLLEENFEKKRVINIYIGTPHRLLKLIERGAIEAKDCRSLRYMIFDCRLNKKTLSLFDIPEVRQDALDVVLQFRHLVAKGKLKFYCH